MSWAPGMPPLKIDVWTVPWPADARHRRGGVPPSVPHWGPPHFFHPCHRDGDFLWDEPPLCRVSQGQGGAGRRQPGGTLTLLGTSPLPYSRWLPGLLGDGCMDELQELLAGSLHKPQVQQHFPRGGLGRRSHSPGSSLSLGTRGSGLSRLPVSGSVRHLPWGFLRVCPSPGPALLRGLVASQAFVQTLLDAQVIEAITAKGLDVSHLPRAGPCPLSSSSPPNTLIFHRAQRHPPGREGPPAPQGAPCHQGKRGLVERTRVQEETVRTEQGNAAAEGGSALAPPLCSAQSPTGPGLRPLPTPSDVL